MTNATFAVLYTFNVLDGKEQDFINAWSSLTKLIYQYEESYGSRLHKISNNQFIAYAQWPDKETWENSGAKLPASAALHKQQMKESCSDIKTEFELNVVCDLLKYEVFNL